MPAAVEDYAAIAKGLRSLTSHGSAVAEPANSIDRPTSPGRTGNIASSAAPGEGTDFEWQYYFWISPLPSPRSVGRKLQ